MYTNTLTSARVAIQSIPQPNSRARYTDLPHVPMHPLHLHFIGVIRAIRGYLPNSSFVTRISKSVDKMDKTHPIVSAPCTVSSAFYRFISFPYWTKLRVLSAPIDLCVFWTKLLRRRGNSLSRPPPSRLPLT